MSSYVTADHAAWVEQNAQGWRRMRRTRAGETRARMAARGWWATPDKLNPFQARTMDILGMVGGGIYNAPITWDDVIWHERYLVVPWKGSLATFDFCGLTRLVFLCHAARIRCEIQMERMRLCLVFHDRGKAEAGGLPHPDIEEALKAFEAYLPPDHRVWYEQPGAISGAGVTTSAEAIA